MTTEKLLHKLELAIAHSTGFSFTVFDSGDLSMLLRHARRWREALVHIAEGNEECCDAHETDTEKVIEHMANVASKALREDGVK